jgi:hypothetical protein
MRKSHQLALVLCFTLLLSLSSIAAAQVALIDYVGFAWETGDILPSDPGDVMAFTAVATQIDAIFGVDLQSEEVTVYVYGLVSTGEFPLGGGLSLIGYTGGTIEVYADPSEDHDWGINPPNAQQGTFTNGTLLLQGSFTSFSLGLDTAGSGSFEGYIDGIGGTVASACTGCEFTFGGAFGRELAQMPDGYHLQIDGVLEVDESVSIENKSFGAVKSLY